jgi:hypothetical protein
VIDLEEQLTASVLAPNCGHVLLPVVAAPTAGLLWQRPFATNSSPNSALNSFAELFGELAMLAAAESKPFTDEVTEGQGIATDQKYAVADRYGGAGIGRNGGSGRNALVNGFLVKGVGRTPLVGQSTPLSHASGGAYLEECVREAIFSEVVSHDFPYGAVPALGILGTGLVQDWP